MRKGCGAGRRERKRERGSTSSGWLCLEVVALISPWLGLPASLDEVDQPHAMTYQVQKTLLTWPTVSCGSEIMLSKVGNISKILAPTPNCCMVDLGGLCWTSLPVELGAYETCQRFFLFCYTCVSQKWKVWAIMFMTLVLMFWKLLVNFAVVHVRICFGWYLVFPFKLPLLCVYIIFQVVEG